jgi:prenylcysteine oxidase/farnesylcysteine lyase
LSLSRKDLGKVVEVEITIFDERSTVGGRMVLSEKNKHSQYYLYAEDIAAGNLLPSGVLRERAEAIKNEVGKNEVASGVREVGVFDGNGMVAQFKRPISETSWGSWLGLVLKYGASVWRAKALPTGTMARWDRLLALTQKGRYASVDEMVEVGGVEDTISLSAKERLGKNGIGEKYSKEVVAPQLLRQLGQGVEEISDLALSMALERENEIMAAGMYAGIFEKTMDFFVKKSKATLRLQTRVTSIRREGDGWVLGIDGAEEEVFDKVIIAAPWNTSSLLLHQQEQGVYYRPVWVTFLVTTNKLDAGYFKTSSVPDQILPIQGPGQVKELEGIHEIAFLRPIFGPDLAPTSLKYLYRVLSSNQMSKIGMATFGDAGVVEMIEEEAVNAYPLLYPRSQSETLGKFEIRDGLWHTSVAESVASSTDWSWVVGENVGRLVGAEIELESKKKKGENVNIA